MYEQSRSAQRRTADPSRRGNRRKTRFSRSAGLDTVSDEYRNKCSPTSPHEERHSEQSFGSYILELAPYENPLWKYFFWLQMSGVCSLKNSSSGEFRTRTNYRVMPAESGKSLKLKVHKWCARMLEGKKEDEEKEGKRKKKNYKEYEEK